MSGALWVHMHQGSSGRGRLTQGPKVEAEDNTVCRMGCNLHRSLLQFERKRKRQDEQEIVLCI